MANPQASPISQLLHTLGLTREDLNKRSDQMRQFLTTDDAVSSRVVERDNRYRVRSGSDLRTHSRSAGSSSSLARSLSCASSSSLREGTPPATPVKSEPHEGGIPHRHMDSMEMVIERQRRQRRNRREREREANRNVPHPPSPSPSNASQSGSSQSLFTQSREDIQMSSASSVTNSEEANKGPETVEPPPATPQKNKYYREHTMHNTGSQSRKDSSCKTETPTPTRLLTHLLPQSQPVPQYFAYPGYMAHPHYMTLGYGTTVPSPVPITPQNLRTQPFHSQQTPSPLPPSSPPPATSPQSSPARVNLVSSPGPMGPAPEEEEYDDLPYKLPPGPYSPTKPDLSYAALVGRAILSSPGHRLTLQEIYDWITIVHPHYKRGETTWMNSIRHVLSTTVVFRKVPRDRSVGRTLWAIYNEDLDCFKDGGFKKHLCKDYANGNDGKGGQGSSSRGRGKTRKRGDDDGDVEPRKTKRTRKEPVPSINPAISAGNSSFINSATFSSHPLFPPTRPTPHHQPYYESCLPAPQPLPAEIIFPPLPAAAAFNRVVNQSSNLSSISQEQEASPVDSEASLSSSQQNTSIYHQASSSSLSSLPELTPNRDSSSPPSSLPPTSDVDLTMHDNHPDYAHQDETSGSVTETRIEGGSEVDGYISAEVGDDDIFNTTLLGPVKFWGQSPQASGLLQPGIELFDNEDNTTFDRKGKRKQSSRRGSLFPPVPTSPTLSCRTKSKPDCSGRPVTPPPSLVVPSTPPRTRQQHRLSSVRTPISHKGVHMSPTASLAHYKSNLDPPPVYNPHELVQEPEDDEDPMRTPRKRTSLTGSSANPHGPPVTPRKLIFSGLGESPFRTPSGGLSTSPFRTPGTRAIFDPHDPRTLLDEELNRSYDSPTGLFGKERGSLLYDSPGLDNSPGKYSRWW